MSPSRSSVSARRWLPYITVEGSLATVFITFTGGAFLTGMALLLGANDFEIGLLGAVPFLAQVAQLLSAFLVDRTGARKTITVVSSAVARQLWWLAIPLMLISDGWRLEAFITLVVISNIAIMVATPSWMSWMADLIPGRMRGRYFGTRSAVVAVTTMITTVGGGIALDSFRNHGLEAGGYAVILATGCLFALAAVILLNRLPDRPAATIKRAVAWRQMISPLADARFRLLVKVSLGWNFAVGIAAPFFAAHMLTNLKMTFTQISIYTVLVSTVAILLNRPWGVMIDRFGCKPVMLVCAFGIAVVPFVWFFPRADSLWILGPEAVYSGILWTGFNLALFNIPIASSPRDGRTLYLAVFSVVSGVGFFAASLLGGMLAESWADIRWMIGGQQIINYHLLFGLSGLLRLLAAFLFVSLREPHDNRFPVMIQFMGYSFLKWFSLGRQVFPRAVRHNQSDEDYNHQA